MDAELQAAREALARELYAYRCGDSGLAPTRHGLNLFLAAVVKQAAGTEKAAGRTLRLRGLQLGPRSGKAIARALCGSGFGGLDLFPQLPFLTAAHSYPATTLLAGVGSR